LTVTCTGGCIAVPLDVAATGTGAAIGAPATGTTEVMVAPGAPAAEGAEVMARVAATGAEVVGATAAVGAADALGATAGAGATTGTGAATGAGAATVDGAGAAATPAGAGATSPDEDRTTGAAAAVAVAVEVVARATTEAEVVDVAAEDEGHPLQPGGESGPPSMRDPDEGDRVDGRPVVDAALREGCADGCGRAPPRAGGAPVATGPSPAICTMFQPAGTAAAGSPTAAGEKSRASVD
jgi:hypothetical protein